MLWPKTDKYLTSTKARAPATYAVGSAVQSHAPHSKCCILLAYCRAISLYHIADGKPKIHMFFHFRPMARAMHFVLAVQDLSRVCSCYTANILGVELDDPNII